MRKNNRLRFLEKMFSTRLKKLIRKGKLIENEEGYIIDPAYKNYIEYKNQNDGGRKPTDEDFDIWNIYNYLFMTDTTKNKEYLTWLLNLYFKQTKERYPLDHENYDVTVDEFGGERFRFFEDVETITDEFHQFNDLKKTKILTSEKKDINNYDSIGEFKFIFKGLMSGGQAIKPQEMNLIRQGEAEIIENDNTHYLIKLKTQTAAKLFGTDSTWCTAANAGSRFSNMYESYSKQGDIYLLVDKKPVGQPYDRFQIHFPTKQVMMLNNRSNTKHFKGIVDQNLVIKNTLIKIYLYQTKTKIDNSSLKNVINSLDIIGLGVDTNNYLELIEKLEVPDIKLNCIELSLTKEDIDKILTFGFVESLTLIGLKNYNLSIKNDSRIKSLILSNVNDVSVNFNNKAFKTLTLSDSKIKSLSGNIKQLDILVIHRSILPEYTTKLDLSGCINLKSIDIIGSNITHINNLSNCKNLRFFNVQNSELKFKVDELLTITDNLINVILSVKSVNEVDFKRIKSVNKQKLFGVTLTK